MKITRYKVNGDIARLIDYRDAGSEISVGRMGVDTDLSKDVEDHWYRLHQIVSEVYGQDGVYLREVKWSYPSDQPRTTRVTISAKVPHWTGPIKTEFPRFDITDKFGKDSFTGEEIVSRVYPAKMEDIGEVIDQLHDALCRYVRKGTMQLNLDFGNEVDESVQHAFQMV